MRRGKLGLGARNTGPGKRLRIRRGRAADAPAILALEEHFPGDRMSARSVRSLLRSRSALIYVAVDPNPGSGAPGHGLAGALILLTRRGSARARIYSIVVSPAARGQGLGRRLVEHAERAARRLGCAAISLEVREDNAPARALYHGLGYTELGRLPEYYEDGGSGVRLRRPLRPA